MIKTRYSKIFLGVVVLGVLLSFGAGAVETTTDSQGRPSARKVKDATRDSNREEATETFCENISERADELGNNIAQKEERVRTRQEERLANWTEKTGRIDAKMTSLRAAWDANRDAQFEKLMARAKTETQTEAVNQFEVTTRAAITERRESVDSAMETFREGVKNAIATRQGQLDKIVTDLQSTRVAALEKAKSDCASGANAQTVRTNMRTMLQAGKNKLQSDKQNETKVGATVKNLVQVRQQSVEDALDKFKTKMEAARAELKKAFPEEVAATPASVESGQ